MTVKRAVLSAALGCLLLSGCAGPEGPGGSGSGDVSGPPSGSAAPSGDQSVQGPVYRVEADWSVLEGREEHDLPPAVQQRWYPEYVDRLIPREDYGSLVPFAGARVFAPFPMEGDEDYAVPRFLYGLMTAEGKIVMDAVCTGISRLTYPLEGGEYAALPVLKLEVGDAAHGSLTALAAGNGSWATGFRYLGCAAGPSSILAGTEDGLVLIAPRTGEEVKSWTWAQLGIDSPNAIPWQGWDPYSAVQWTGDSFFLGCFGGDWDRACFLDPLTGAVTTSPAQDWYEELDGRLAGASYWEVSQGADGAYTFTRGEDLFRLTAPLEMGEALPYVAGEDRVVFDDCQGCFAVTDRTGRAILPPQEGTLYVLQSDWEEGGSWLAVQPPEGEEIVLYDWNGKETARLPAAGGWCYMAGPLVEIQSDSAAAYYRPEDGACVYRTYFGLDGEPEV